MGCLMRQLADAQVERDTAKAENERLRENMRMLSGAVAQYAVAEAAREQEQFGPTYRLHDGNSESVTGTLTVGEGGILLARDRWESSDLEAAAALEPGQRMQLADDGFWIERVE